MPSASVLFNGQIIQNLDLIKEVYVIGRHEACEIHIDNLGISRNHARIIRSGGAYFIEDLNSANGTFVNGSQVKRHELTDGDIVTIAKYEITYHASAADGSAPTPAASAPRSSSLDGGESLNTMEMDAGTIRKRLEEMRRDPANAKLAEEGRATNVLPRSTGGGAKPLSAIENAEIKAREAELASLRKGMLLNRIILIIIALAALGELAYIMLK